MFKKLRDKIREYRRDRRIARQIDPKAILALAVDLKELAITASKISHMDPEVQARTKRILQEMDQLGEIALKPEFKRLSPRKRLELRKSLLLSKEQILETMHAAPAPTSTIQ